MKAEFAETRDRDDFVDIVASDGNTGAVAGVVLRDAFNPDEWRLGESDLPARYRHDYDTAVRLQAESVDGRYLTKLFQFLGSLPVTSGVLVPPDVMLLAREVHDLTAAESSKIGDGAFFADPRFFMGFSAEKPGDDSGRHYDGKWEFGMAFHVTVQGKVAVKAYPFAAGKQLHTPFSEISDDMLTVLSRGNASAVDDYAYTVLDPGDIIALSSYYREGSGADPVIHDFVTTEYPRQSFPIDGLMPVEHGEVLQAVRQALGNKADWYAHLQSAA